jgi:diguanylate cyclase (GGDEF)-like protein
VISLKKYLDSDQIVSDQAHDIDRGEVVRAAIAAYRSALVAMGNCSVDACPALGGELKDQLESLGRNLVHGVGVALLQSTDSGVREQLRDWGQSTARHYLKKSDEVRDLLLVMARMAESVGSRDERCAGQISEVTARLTEIASLEDLTEIRASIVKSASELKTSIDRMTSEGKAAIDRLSEQVSTYRAKLEKAEEIAFRDALTGVRSRLCVERHIERRIAEGITFCVAIVDIDSFKRVNDVHGHLVGDEVLTQFSTELVSACRSNDVIGRWGGDEFVIVLDCALLEATAQSERLTKWVCGNYTIQGNPTALRLRVDASIGMAEFHIGDTMHGLLARADAAMYENKASSKKASKP